MQGVEVASEDKEELEAKKTFLSGIAGFFSPESMTCKRQQDECEGYENN